MFSEGQKKEIRDHFERAQNPVVFYDNDADGLCSYVLFRRFLDRGRGVIIRSFPELDQSYVRKVRELEADYVFVFDKHAISRDFVSELDKLGIPIVWIDHHDIENEDLSEFDNFFVYNVSKNKGDLKSSEPVTFLLYDLIGRKEDDWIAMMGCIADHYLPDFSKEFGEKYPEFWGDVESPFDAYFGTEIGKIAMALNFGLKDSISNVVHLQNFLISCGNPGEVLEENGSNFQFRKKYGEIKKKYDKLVEKARKEKFEKFLFFTYSGDMSISSEVSNQLYYENPDIYVIVAYKSGGVVNISMRGKGVKGILENILKDLEGASGGGHEDAVGARIALKQLDQFENKFKDIINGK